VKRALAVHGLDIVSEATYYRGASFTEPMTRQVEILADGDPQAIISIGSYEACAAFIRDARDMNLNIPIANLSFVGSENMLELLSDISGPGKDYTVNLINTQVVPSYEDLSLPAVREYRELMDEYDPEPPAELVDAPYTPQRYSFVSFEGFLNAKMLAAVLDRMGAYPKREWLNNTVESMHDFDLGIKERASFSESRHQGFNHVYFTTVEDGKFVPIREWSRWMQ
jgi:ABC-type branched-subunit amino acid transport system substrate-binding protein